MQHYVFIDQRTHAMRLAWYRDEYVRTSDGWRIRRRATTFMRKHGGVDSGRQHDPLAKGKRETKTERDDENREGPLDLRRVVAGPEKDE